MKQILTIVLFCLVYLLPTVLYAEPYSLPHTEIRQLNSVNTGTNYILYISLPKSYNQEKTRYPVVYMLDADYSFAIAHNTVEHFIDRRDLPEMILVGIAYPGASQDMSVYRNNRIKDYTPTNAPLGVCGSNAYNKKESGGGENFLKFIRSELIVYIEKNFRVKENDRTIVGHSAGGMFGTYVLFTQPDTFQRYILVSPSLWWDNQLAFKLEQEYSLNHTSLKANVFYSIGRWENPKECPMVEQMAQLVGRIKSRKYNGLNINNYVFPRETHNSVFPGALSRGLRMVFEKM
jgi:predicted alpha/beta superfamily hydrolase